MKQLIDALRPMPNAWFETALEYTGHGRAEFSDPPGFIEGPAIARFDGFSRREIEMRIEKMESPGQPQNATVLISGEKVASDNGKIKYLIGSRRNPCTRFSISTAHGILRSTGELLADCPIASETVRFHVFQATFQSKNESSPKYWVLPLSNLVTDFRFRHLDLDRHPLRIFPTPRVPDGLSTEDALLAQAVANQKNRLILFDFAGQPGFIEALPDYEDLRSQLDEMQRQRVTTAVMVGDLAGAPSGTSDEIQPWFPFQVLRLLGIVTGTDVGTTWVEFRDGNAGLVRRIHGHFSKPTYSHRRQLINEFVHGGSRSGIGYLLTTFLALPAQKRDYLDRVLSHLASGRIGTGELHDSLDHIVRGFEILCREHNLSSQDLTASLTADEKQAIDRTLSSAAEELDGLAKSATASSRRSAGRDIGKIAERTRSWGRKAKHFGLAVANLLEEFGIPDAEVIDRHYSQSPRAYEGKWHDVLSHYRNATIHEGYFEFERSHDRRDVFRVTDHLQDLLIRLVFKEIGYAGMYQKFTSKWNEATPVDWVTLATKAEELGY